MVFENRVALVTGGAGFIGSHLVRALLARGCWVRVVDDLSTGRRENLPDDPRCAFWEGSILDEPLLSQAMEGVDFVFHVAAAVSVPMSVDDPVLTTQINAMGTLQVLETARKHKVSCVVYSSSAAVYGDLKELPLRESQVPQPESPYGASKYAGEVLCGTYARTFGLKTVSLRYFNVFGPRQREDTPYANAIPIFIDRILKRKPIPIFGDGEQTRDFIYVEDVVEANLLALCLSEGGGETFNCAGGREVSINELVRLLFKVAGYEVPVEYLPPRPGDVRRSVGDATHAEKRLGFKARWTLEEGLQRTFEYFARLAS
jgi:UDP-glucose 4-epimerase